MGPFFGGQWWLKVMCFFCYFNGIGDAFLFLGRGMGMGGESGLEIVSDLFLKPCCCCCCFRKTQTNYQIDGNESDLSTLQHFFFSTQIIKLSKSSPNMPPSSELLDYLRVDDLGD